MAKKILKKKRSPRLPVERAVKEIGDVNEFVRDVTNENIQGLYDFIYGHRRDELGILLRGIERMLGAAKTKKEKEKANALMMVACQAVVNRWQYQENQFRRRFKHNFSDEIQKAQSGNDSSLFSVVAFDKEFLFEDFVKTRILRAEAEQDYMFLSNLGEAVKRKSWDYEDIRGHRDESQLEFRRLVHLLDISLFDFKSKGSVRKLSGTIDRLQQQGQDIPYFTHLGVVKKILKRMSKM